MPLENLADRAKAYGISSYIIDGNDAVAVYTAAKEAVAKALGSGFDGAIAPLSIEIANDSNGAPRVILRDSAAELAAMLGISSWRLSISHAGGIAMASAIGVRD